jgi:F-type H+-transporting ATPase subunit delta
LALAEERRLLDPVAADLATLKELLRESDDLSRLIRSPVIGRDAQGRAIAAVAERAELQTVTRNFLGLLARNRRLFALPEMIAHYLATLAARRGEITAEIAVAQELSMGQRERITAELARAAGRKVTLDIRVDPSLLAGLSVRLGSRLVDASLKHKLHRLEMVMKGVR